MTIHPDKRLLHEGDLLRCFRNSASATYASALPSASSLAPCISSFVQSLRSVSYTHLDVYKRQLLREDNALLLQLLQDSSATAQDGKLYVLGEEKLRKLIDSISKQLEAERNAVTIYQELEYPRLPRGV